MIARGLSDADRSDPDVSDETIARVTRQLERLMDRKPIVDEQLGFRVKVRQLFILLLAMERPVGPPEIRPVASAMKRTRYAESLFRLRHQHAVYHQLWRLHDDGMLARMRQGRRVLYQPTAATRDAMQRLLWVLSGDGDTGRGDGRACESVTTAPTG